jgi:hypothetical protein
MVGETNRRGFLTVKTVCVCVHAHSGLLLHATIRSCEHVAYIALFPPNAVCDTLVSYLSSCPIYANVKFSASINNIQYLQKLLQYLQPWKLYII